MRWQSIEPTRLMRDYGSWITPCLVENNRVIDLLGLADTPYQAIPYANAWTLHDANGRLLLILAHVPREIALVHHPDLKPDVGIVSALHQKFPGSWVLTCHNQQCDDWEAAASIFGSKDIPLLNTWLYQVRPHQLRTRPLPEGLRFTRLPLFSKQIGRYIQGFMLDALEQKIDTDEQRTRFEKQEFYGLLAGEQLLSIAAVTRRLFHGRCLSYVYTPNKYRGRDYAALVVERLCRFIFEQPGMELVYLYADQANPCSNRLYQKLGFEVVCVSKTF